MGNFSVTKNFGGAKRLNVSRPTPPHIKFFFPAGEAKSAPPLGPTIAMFQLNIVQVCKDLNDQSSAYTAGIPLRAKVFKPSFSARTYTLQIFPPSIKFFLECALCKTIDLSELEKLQDDETYESSQACDIVSITLLYDLVRIVVPEFEKRKAFANTLFSTIKSMKGFITKVSF